MEGDIEYSKNYSIFIYRWLRKLRKLLTAPLPLYLGLLIAGAPYLTQAWLNQRALTEQMLPDGEKFGIQELIAKVRAELQASASKDPMFHVSEFDLEVSFVVKSGFTQSGKVNYELVAVDSGTSFSRERVQKLVLRMKAVAPGKVISDSPGPVPPVGTNSTVLGNEPPPANKENQR